MTAEPAVIVLVEAGGVETGVAPDEAPHLAPGVEIVAGDLREEGVAPGRPEGAVATQPGQHAAPRADPDERVGPEEATGRAIATGTQDAAACSARRAGHRWRPATREQRGGGSQCGRDAQQAAPGDMGGWAAVVRRRWWIDSHGSPDQSRPLSGRPGLARAGRATRGMPEPAPTRPPGKRGIAASTDRTSTGAADGTGHDAAIPGSQRSIGSAGVMVEQSRVAQPTGQRQSRAAETYFLTKVV